MRSRSARRARIWLASRDLERLRRAGRGWSRIESYTGTNGVGDRHQRSANILSRRGHGGQIDEHEEHRRSLGGTNGGRERAPCEKDSQDPSTSSMAKKDSLPCSSTCNTKANRPLSMAK